MENLIDLGLVGTKDSQLKREKLGEALGIGYSNGKQLLSKLNRYGVSKEEFEEALKKI